MSAFVLSNKNYDFVLSALIDRMRGDYIYVNDEHLQLKAGNQRSGFEKNLTLVGNLLRNANIASVDYRYREKSSKYDEYTFKYTHYSLKDKIITALKILDCYDYQSCEIPDYDKTEACRVVNIIRKTLIASLPEYDSAPWGL